MAQLTERSLQLHAYGKLPWSRDFVWFNLVGSTAQAFREFIDATAAPLCSALPGDQASLQLFFSRSCFGEPLWAVIQHSSDQGGMRPYPFVVFATNGGEPHIDGRIATNSIDLFRALSRAQDLVRLVRAPRELDAIGAEEAMRLEIPNPLSAAARDAWSRALAVDLFAYGVALYGQYDTFVRALWRVHRLANARRLGSGARAPTGIWIPIASDPGPTVQVDVWLQAAAASQAGFDPLSVWLRSESGSSREEAWIFLRKPLASDIIGLSGERPDGVLDLRHGSSRDDLPGFDVFAERIRTLTTSRRWYVAEMPALLAACAGAG